MILSSNSLVHDSFLLHTLGFTIVFKLYLAKDIKSAPL